MILNRSTKQERSSQLGRTMIETLMVLAIYGLLATGVYGLISLARQSHQNSAAVLEILNMTDGIRDLYKLRDSNITVSSDFEMKYAMSEGIIKSSDSGCLGSDPTSNACNPAHAISPISSGITLSSYRVWMGSGESYGDVCGEEEVTGCKGVFEITLTNITEGQCGELISADWGEYIFKIQGQIVKKALNYPFRKIDALALCRPDESSGAINLSLAFF